MICKSLVALSAVALVAAIAPARANLVTNGSFEATSLSNKGSFAGNVTGWSGGSKLTFLDFPGTADNGTYLSVWGPFPHSSQDGGNFVEADGDPSYSSAISQTIHGLTVGASYTLNFDQAAGQQYGYNGSTTERWKVSLGNDVQLSTLFSLPSHGVGAWQQQTMTFIASATSEVLSFLAVGTPNGAPPISFLDGVSLNATPAAVPEPATLALLGTGVVGFLAARRRRKQSR